MNKIHFFAGVFVAILIALFPLGTPSSVNAAQISTPSASAAARISEVPFAPPQEIDLWAAPHLLYLPRLVTPPYRISPEPGVYSPAGANLEITYRGVSCFYAHVAPLGDWPNQRAPYDDMGGDCHGDQVTIWLDIAAEIAFDQIRIDFYNEYAVLISSRILYVGQYTFRY